MGDVVGDLAQAGHELADAREHLVEADGEPVQFVAGAVDRQSLRHIARHQRMGGDIHRVDAAQHAARHERRAERGQRGEQHQRQRQRAHHDRADAAAVAEIVADQQAKAVRQRIDAGERAPCDLAPIP